MLEPPQPSCFAGPVTYVKFLPQPPRPSPRCRGTQIILISSFMECNVMRILQPNYEKKCWKEAQAPCWKGNLSWNTRARVPLHYSVPAKITLLERHLVKRVILAGTLEWRSTLWVPPLPGCPRVCPPWAHRSYATEILGNKLVTRGARQKGQLYRCPGCHHRVSALFLHWKASSISEGRAPFLLLPLPFLGLGAPFYLFAPGTTTTSYPT